MYPSYRYPVSSLYTGSSLGNLLTFARLSADTNVRGLWSAIDNQFYLGDWDIDLHLDDALLPPCDTLFAPESQTTVCCKNELKAEKQFFLVYTNDRAPLEPSASLQAGCFLVRCTNPHARPLTLLIKHTLRFAPQNSAIFTKQPLPDQTEKKMHISTTGNECEVLTAGNPEEARLFGSPVAWENQTVTDGAVAFDYRITLAPDENIEIPFIIAYSPVGIQTARAIFEQCRDVRGLLRQSVKAYRDLLARTHVYTPDALINRGLQWAKINTVRVQHRYRAGEGFTNDPPQDIVVIRDLAWYVFGADYLTPDFSRNMLDLAERCAFHPDGKLTEYIHAAELPPVLHDYKLNINDDSPLYVYALYHHALTAGNEATLAAVYPLMKRACDYILSQIHQDLVRCYADGTNVWGICSWRNIIDDYNLTGAVTEINAECYHALCCCADVAEQVRDTTAAAFYRQKADALKNAINARLVSEQSGMYLLNLENNGMRHHDVTGDLIFPVMFGVADEPMKRRILERLTDADMWTRFGSRTVSKAEKNYDPDRGYQLVGGLWHNLTAWVAYCIRKENPEKLVEGMRNIYSLCEPESPIDYVNVVPGEFPERIHGESFISRGMAMSPWMPPTYLWLGVEGLLGVTPGMDCLTIDPALPMDEWGWIGVKDLLYHGREVSAFLYGGTLYATEHVASHLPVRVGRIAESTVDNAAIFAIGLCMNGSTVVFAAADAPAAGTVEVLVDGKRHRAPVELAARGAVLIEIPLR